MIKKNLPSLDYVSNLPSLRAFLYLFDETHFLIEQVFPLVREKLWNREQLA